ncbi:MAG: cadmium-translocating P-type ATPase [Woeseiaceae bacterium]|nr:cadmium-translocating P-type ATPase [Woeseiaceae bacterium]NIP19564.1 cadmium-translocating P-type ATPase [Woeseiaceae bacterium]NIS88518.1 cadmium-translocating P-type ATPase [Woeseiaceae bacterium]
MIDSACFHCALPVDPRDKYDVEIDGKLRPVCCPGCKAVAELIRDTGMSNYYAMRDAPQPGVGRPADQSTAWQVYDRADMLAAFAEARNGEAEATVYVGGMYCSACGWLIETTMARTPGVVSADINPVTHRLRVRWSTKDLGLGGILATLASLGYDPQPLAPESAARPELLEQRAALKRLLVASLGMMQVMMFAIGLYAGDFQGMEPSMQRFLRWVSFLVTTPVVFYSARPFFSSALRGIKARTPGMDLPVSIAVGSAYVGSVYATLTHAPAVWFDSVVMFVFFLTLGRFLEMRARHRSIDRSTAMSNVLPPTVSRTTAAGFETIPSSRLVAGDVVRVRPGEAVPADGRVVDGGSSVDEALLTGEARPVQKSVGDEVAAGSMNIDGALHVRVEKTGGDTTLGTISRLSERARYARPEFVQLADRIASYIVIAILVIAVLVGSYWYSTAPDRAFVITLSVLVVTCPCALALATPAAFATAGTRLAQLHLLLTNGNAIEALARASKVLLDKTGTITRGSPALEKVEVLEPGYTEQECLDIAAALEAVSIHPIAKAFPAGSVEIGVSDQRIVLGQGVAGTIDGVRWRIGKAVFAGEKAAEPGVYLGRDKSFVARFDMSDELRDNSRETIQALTNLGLETGIVSGDREEVVRAVADRLDIREYHAESSPEEKLSVIRQAQQQGDRIIMVGDGINDAPVLAGADASIALAHGAELAQTSADVIMLGESLAPVATAIGIARKTLRIVRQNLAWAIVYNTAALPLAAMGYVPPWAAAIGMSMSSLIVVLNALRIGRYQEQ